MNSLIDDLGLKRYLPAAWTKRGPIVPVLRFSGAIGAVTPLRPGLSLSTSAAAIDKAFAMSGAKAVAIQINSPGGSAVQSTLIYKRIRALAAEKNLKVYVFAEDVAASGGYMLALAGDEIYADPSSIVGSEMCIRDRPAGWTKRGPIVPVLRFSGAIGAVTPLRPGLSLSTLSLIHI